MDAMHILEIAGTAVGLLYIYLEYKASVWLWLTGIVMPALYIFVYYWSGFYADMGINIYYLVAGLYGWIIWLGKLPSKKAPREVPSIGRTPASRYLPLFGVSLVSFVIILWVLLRFTDSTVPYGDSFTTALSIAGLWMLSRKYVEQWLVWMVVDFVSCALFIYKGLYPTGVLYGLYGVIAIFGYFKWIRMMKRQEETTE